MARKEWQRTQYCGELTESFAGQQVTLDGWVQRTRNLGGVIFVWLRDRTGLVQVVFSPETCDAETFAVGESLRSEYVVSITGEVALRAEKDVTDKLKTGKIEMIAKKATLLNAAATPPIYIDDNADENELIRLKYRYLDLRKPRMQENLRMRAKVLSTIRRHMDECGFTEVETPILSKSTPEGARDYLVPSRVRPGEFYALPQSPQIYKQLLMLAGFVKYYQVARCFRDEDSRADRQPEFTQLDIEMSFVEPEDIQTVVEGAFAKVFKAVKNIDIQLPLPRMTWRQAMDDYGSDKPDTRFASFPQGNRRAGRAGENVSRQRSCLADHRARRDGQVQLRQVHEGRQARSPQADHERQARRRALLRRRPAERRLHGAGPGASCHRQEVRSDRSDQV